MTSQGKETAHNEAFWRAELDGFSAPTPLVVDRSAERGRAPRYEEDEFSVALSGNDLEAKTWVGAWAALLGRYGAEDVVLFGVALVGCEAGPLRVELAWEQPAAAWLAALADALAQRPAAGPGWKALRSESGFPARAPLFESLLRLGQQSNVACPELPWEPPLSICVACPEAAGGAFRCRIRYDAGRFDGAAIRRMGAHLGTLASALDGRPQDALGRLPLLTAAEHTQLIDDWNSTAVDFPREATLHGLFEARVARDPEATAALFGDEGWSYGELNARANRLAHELIAVGVGPDVPVGISLERGLDMIAGLLGIAKAGGAYLPLDPAYPEERLALLLRDSDVSVLLTQTSLAPRFADTRAKLVCMDAPRAEQGPAADANPSVGVQPEHLAYVIYTSGSTGRPKGVLLDHRGRVNNFCDFNRRFSVGPGDRLLALASLSFDMCAYDVFGTLAAGATIVVGDTQELEPGIWAELMLRHEVTLWHSVPALLEMWVEHVEKRSELWPRALRVVLLGGDWIPLSLPERLRALVPAVRVISMGGATEVSMDSTLFEVLETDASWKSIPYGAPMANQRAYVLDRWMQPVPVGVPGELFLGGIGVARGYHARRELTSERFLDNPFHKGRVYRTGDLVRWRADGNLELLGRMDFQVKIRGFRIELGEIEVALRQHPAVRECVLLARDDPGREKRLVAYVIQDPRNAHDAAEKNAAAGQQVERWQSVYDSAYSRDAGQADPTFNIASWDSSYTGQPIPAEQMREWVDRTVEEVLARGPKRVLEIGCGTGLLLFRIAPECESYHGTDISQVALEHVRKYVAERGLEQVQVFDRSGADFGGIAEDSFDAVVLNSIVMDFPDLHYLGTVLRGAARVVAPGGFVFVGDVRNRATAELFQSSVQLERAPDGWSTEELTRSVQKLTAMEEELVIDPDFFVALQRQVGELAHVEVHLKRGLHENEMTRFRYNVVLHVGQGSRVPVRRGETLDWSSAGLDLAGVADKLRDEAPPDLLLEGVPSARTFADVRMFELLSTGAPGTASDLRAQRDAIQNDSKLVQPEAFWALESELPYAVDVRFARSGAQDRFDVFFARHDENGERPRLLAFDRTLEAERPLSDYGNDPLRSSVEKSLGPRLREHLAAQLPPYMIPAAFVFLERFPLNPNGKINRAALLEPDHLRPELEERYVAPHTALESVLAGIWAQGLGLDRVGVHDGFVALGGNSLLATQLASRVRDVFGVELPLKDCLNLHLSELAQRLQEAARTAGVDVGEIAEIYLEVSALSTSEVSSMLEQGASGQ